jgi:hypothetical protein
MPKLTFFSFFKIHELRYEAGVAGATRSRERSIMPPGTTLMGNG